jgi:hypothetical protein
MESDRILIGALISVHPSHRWLQLCHVWHRTRLDKKQRLALDVRFVGFAQQANA